MTKNITSVVDKLLISRLCFVDEAADFVTPLKKRRLARESLSVDGSLRSISEEEDSPSTRMASPPDAVPPNGIVSAIDNFTAQVTLAASANECHSEVGILCFWFSFNQHIFIERHRSSGKPLQITGVEYFSRAVDAFADPLH